MKRPDDDECWDALLRRDGRYDGRFVFGVVTTGIYCRPSCRSRHPLRKNVRFFASRAEASGTELRSCLRCQPNEAGDARLATIRALCDHIREQANSGEKLTLEALAAVAGLSPSQLQRAFRAVVGVTPRQYVEACRLENLKRELRDGESVTDAIYGAGFGSNSRVYERIDSRFGMTPTAYRAGGEDQEISYASVDGPSGLMLLAATDRGLCFVQFGESRERLIEELRREYPAARIAPMGKRGASLIRGWISALQAHLRDGEPNPDLPLDVRGSAFRFKVWRFLQSIPTGETRSYGEVAAALGCPKSARAVARACAANKLAIVIPCHRVIRADGGLGGYRWGIERKRQLLERERTLVAT